MIDEKYKFLVTDTEDGNVEIIYEGEAGGLELSETSGTYTYPTAEDVSYTPSDTSWNVTNVKQALDYLYSIF